MKSDPPRQLPLDLATAAGRSRDDLLVTRSNAAAAALIDRWPDWPAPVVVLAGPVGAGKSHIAAIWKETAHAFEARAAAIGADAIAAAAEGPVLVEDADAGQLDEAGLFHLINAARAGGTTLLLTARRFPAAWGVQLPDLASRLKAATTVEIAEPEDALLAGVITKLFADRQVVVEPHVITYIVHRIERSLATASRVVDRLDRAALETKSRISRHLAGAVIGALEEGQGELDL